MENKMTAREIFDLYLLILKRRVSTKYVLLRAVMFSVKNALPGQALTPIHEPEDLLRLTAAEIVPAQGCLESAAGRQEVEVTAKDIYQLLK